MDFCSGEYRVIHTGASEKNPGTGWVGIIVNKAKKKREKGKKWDRKLKQLFQTKPRDLPATNNRDEEVEEVYENIDELIKHFNQEVNLILMDDWSAMMGEAKVNNISGAYGLGKRNDRGDCFIEF